MARTRARDEDALAVMDEQPKKRSRHKMKLMMAKTTSRSSKATYERNATESPLLRCSPEIRNRIWYFALCGKTIHITSREHSTARHTVCRTRGNNEDQDLSTSAKTLKSFQQYHSGCINQNRPVSDDPQYKLPVALLRACRQIHQEAALLPYEGNTFAFVSLRCIEMFLKDLILAQARAIERIHIWYRLGRPYIRSSFAALLRSKLKGLKSLTVDVEVMSIGYHMPHVLADELTTAYWGGHLRRSILQFQHLPAISTTVTALAVSDVVNDLATFETVRDWVKEIKDSIMQPAV